MEGEVDDDSLQDMVWYTLLLAKIILTTIVARASERTTGKGLRGEGTSQSGEEKGKLHPLKSETCGLIVQRVKERTRVTKMNRTTR